MMVTVTITVTSSSPRAERTREYQGDTLMSIQDGPCTAPCRSPRRADVGKGSGHRDRRVLEWQCHGGIIQQSLCNAPCLGAGGARVRVSRDDLERILPQEAADVGCVVPGTEVQWWTRI